MQKIIEASYIERFLYKVLHPKEIEQFKSKITIEQKSQFLASRWAVKEALVKASQYKELVFPQTEISRINGKPEIILHDQNDEYFKQQFSEDYETQLSISHEDQFSIAFVILLK